jgi:hypothetical protein
MAALNSRDLFIQNIYPRLLSHLYNATDFSITLEGTSIVVKLLLPEDTPKYVLNYTVKLWRTGETTGTSSTDWWTQPWDTGNMLKVTTLDIARFNLLELPNTTIKRISSSGINYQIACRSTDLMGNISAKSILGSIRIKTISV